MRLEGNCVLDDYAARPASASPQTRQFDYVLHIDGAFETSSTPLAPLSGPLDDKPGYRLVERKGALSVREPASFTFNSESGRLRVWTAPVAGSTLEAILAEGPTNAPDGRMPMLILRARGAGARFLTAIEPVDPKRPVRRVKLGRTGNALVLERD